MPVRTPATRKAVAVAVLLALALAGCHRDEPGARKPSSGRAGSGQVIVQGDDRIAGSLTWHAPRVALDAKGLPDARVRAAKALTDGRLFADADAAIPLYLAILQQAPGDAAARAGLARAKVALLAQGDAALGGAGDDIDALRRAHAVASVARALDPKDARVLAYLARVDQADRLWRLNQQAEADLRAGRLGESGDGALGKLREALRLQPGQARALQGLAAVESGLIRRAEDAGGRADFDNAGRWLALAEVVRPGKNGTIADARARIAAVRRTRIERLRDEGLVALQQRDAEGGMAEARRKLAELLRLAEPGDPAAAELQQRIDLASHYGLFRPGQSFTDALGAGARGPEMVVVPHGAFRMGADADDAPDSERPAHYVRFDRGFAMSRTEVTVGQFAQFVAATGYEPTATRHGWSMAYDRRGGNFVRRNGVDWRHGFDGTVASDDMPVLHVSARDADAYAAWLAKGSRRHYHVPSEAQFEYALRAGSQSRYPWGDGPPPPRAGNVTGGADSAVDGRRWRNAFAGYGDGYWGPAPVAGFKPNAYGLHDLAGNVSEWVADCWHDGYRRAPADGAAWVNPGCRMRVARGGSWASAPAQTRSAWRAPAAVDTTNPRMGFRVVREL
jgi:formylglycine-generating enzyme required for sulfatase activity